MEASHIGEAVEWGRTQGGRCTHSPEDVHTTYRCAYGFTYTRFFDAAVPCLFSRAKLKKKPMPCHRDSDCYVCLCQLLRDTSVRSNVTDSFRRTGCGE